jgi:hypothetical protein
MCQVIGLRLGQKSVFGDGIALRGQSHQSVRRVHHPKGCQDRGFFQAHWRAAHEVRDDFEQFLVEIYIHQRPPLTNSAPKLL